MMPHRHNISDKVWEKINKNLSGSKGYTGRNGVDNRKFVNAVFWILRTGAPWRGRPREYGDWKNTHRRFTQWRDKGICEKILKLVMDEPDLSSTMIDATFVKCHMDASGAKGGNQCMAVSKKGLPPDSGCSKLTGEQKCN